MRRFKESEMKLSSLFAAVSFKVLLAMAVVPLMTACEADKGRKGVTISVVSEENQTDRIARYGKLIEYFERELGVPVTLHMATDYAGTVEALRAKRVEVAYLSPRSYEIAHRVTSGNIEPIVRVVHESGTPGYYSIIIVRADSDIQSLEDLKGKSIAFADVNSTSGYLVPNYFLRKAGIDPSTYFSRTGTTGSHENSVLAVRDGTYDAAATFWNSEDSGLVQNMERKEMIPAGTTRIIWKSPLIPSEPWVVRKDVDPLLREKVIAALRDLENKDPEAWQDWSYGDFQGLIPAKHEDYEEIIQMEKELRALQRD